MWIEAGRSAVNFGETEERISGIRKIEMGKRQKKK